MKIIYKGCLYESIELGGTLIVVDIQEEYERYMRFKPYHFFDWLNGEYDKFDRIIFLFNGPELGFPSESEYKYWLVENGLSEELLDSIDFYDKGYNFFRNAMDVGISDEDIIKLVKYMAYKGINDSRDVEDWTSIGLSDYVIEKLEGSEDAIFVPDVLDYLRNVSGRISLVGGGRNECLKEVELCLLLNGHKYSLISEWVY